MVFRSSSLFGFQWHQMASVCIVSREGPWFSNVTRVTLVTTTVTLVTTTVTLVTMVTMVTMRLANLLQAAELAQ